MTEDGIVDSRGSEPQGQGSVESAGRFALREIECDAGLHHVFGLKCLDDQFGNPEVARLPQEVLSRSPALSLAED